MRALHKAIAFAFLDLVLERGAACSRSSSSMLKAETTPVKARIEEVFPTPIDRCLPAGGL